MEERQLIMNWENDGVEKSLTYGEDFKVVNFNELDETFGLTSFNTAYQTV